MNPEDTTKSSPPENVEQNRAEEKEEISAAAAISESPIGRDPVSQVEATDPLPEVEAGTPVPDEREPPTIANTEQEDPFPNSETPGPGPAAETKAEKPLKKEVLELDEERQKAILEALLYVSDQPLTLDRLSGILGGGTRKELKTLLDELNEDYTSRGKAFEIVEVAQGYQVRTKNDFAKWIAKLKQQKPHRLTRPSLESLAIIAYRQPVTRAEIESIRGVDTGAVLGSLLEKRLIRILGRKEVPGRPILYGTTQEFLELFGLKNLGNLPTLREIESMFEKEKDEEQEVLPDGSETNEQGESLTARNGVEDPGADTRDDDGVNEGPLEEHEDEGEGESTVVEDVDEELEANELDEILRSTKTKIDPFGEEEKEQDATGQQEATGKKETEESTVVQEHETGEDQEDSEGEPSSEDR